MHRWVPMVLVAALAGCASVPGADVEPAPDAVEPAPDAVDQVAPIGVSDSPPNEIAFAAAYGPSTETAVSEPPAATDVTEGDPGQATEVMIVTGEREMRAEDRRHIYRRVARGKNLYARKRIKEAFPLLLDTARRGFKDSQARVGHIYLQGLGDVEPDATQGVGWLGVASSGTTSPGIRNYFNDIWKRIPDTHVPYFEEVVESYRTKYGEQATGVVCELHRPLRSFVKKLGCFYEAALPDEIRETLEEQRDNREALELIEQRLAEAQLVIEEQQRSGAGQTQ